MDMRMMQMRNVESPLRALKAEGISKLVVKLRENLFEVPSQSGNGYYHVRTGRFRWSCSCPDYVHRGSTCKHQLAVAVFLNREVPCGEGAALDPEAADLRAAVIRGGHAPAYANAGAGIYSEV